MPTLDQNPPRSATRPATLTSTADGRDHLISAHATLAGITAGRGKYTALCGHGVVAAPLVVPPGPTCFDCETALHRITTTSTRTRRRGRGVRARLLRHRLPGPDAQPTIRGNHRARRA